MSFKQARAFHPGLAWLIHQRPYRDTSALCEFFTQDHGRISVIVLNCRSKKRRALLIPFQPLWIEVKGEGGLKMLTQIESEGPALRLMGASSFCGLYLNELILKTLTQTDPTSEIFMAYQHALKTLSAQPHQQASTLRHFEMTLLEQLGYALPFHQLKNPEAYYEYSLEQGFIEYTIPADTRLSYDTLKAIEQRNWSTPQQARASKYLMRQAIQAALHDQTLQARTLWQPVEIA
ncbi:MAG: DNA repair protein RecO [Legionellales bacterium]|nr:DNA repair protein RecO [Legionellales bacterium]|tara:strand:+ start:143 stop:844 length:702 start_codon:yes stop_codon:yes gene_type:complete